MTTTTVRHQASSHAGQAHELVGVSPAARAAIAGAEADAVRATRYAVGAVGISFAGNVVHLLSEISSVGELATSHGAAVAAEAMGGPALVFICSHLLMHIDNARPIERYPLWVGFTAGALLSAVHLWAVAFAVLSVGILAGISPAVPYVAAALLPLGVEGASIGSIQQASRFRHQRETLIADTMAAEAQAEAARVEAERLAEADRAERERLAVIEAERAAAEAEAARIAAAEAEAKRAERRARSAASKPRPKRPAGTTVVDQIVAAVETLEERPELMPAAMLKAIGWESTPANRKAAGRARDQILATTHDPGDVEAAVGPALREVV